MYNVLDLSQIKELFSKASLISIGDDFFIGDYSFKAGEPTPFDNTPTRINGYVGIFCVSGNMTLSIDFREFKMGPNSFSILTPMNIIRINNEEHSKDSRFIGVGISSQNMSRVRFDMDSLFKPSTSPLSLPNITLNREEISLGMRYYSLIKKILLSNRPYVNESIMALCSSLIFEIAGSWRTRTLPKDEVNDYQPTRMKIIYDRYIKLVAKYHVTNRAVQFYADKLYISPKYLCKVIKLSSGQTPSYWIDKYTIMEAQNLLKYTNMTIKQIVFKLNFSNQSVFQKYFKSQTGITPLQYRKNSRK